jgi:hypothetical protein
MPICLKAPPFPPLPPLPTGVSIPIFTPPILPDLGLCCKIPIPPIPIPAIALKISFPAAVITTLNTITKAVQAYYDQYTTLSIKCPFE